MVPAPMRKKLKGRPDTRQSIHGVVNWLAGSLVGWMAGQESDSSGNGYKTRSHRIDETADCIIITTANYFHYTELDEMGLGNQIRLEYLEAVTFVLDFCHRKDHDSFLRRGHSRTFPLGRKYIRISLMFITLYPLPLLLE